MLSDMSKTESASINGLPGLGELPGFQQTLSELTMKDDGLVGADSADYAASWCGIGEQHGEPGDTVPARRCRRKIEG